jgi:hypothetical protein
LKEEALDSTMWGARFGRGFGPVVRQTTWMNNECKKLCVKLVTYQNYTNLHGQKNIKLCVNVCYLIF